MNKNKSRNRAKLPKLSILSDNESIINIKKIIIIKQPDGFEYDMTQKDSEEECEMNMN